MNIVQSIKKAKKAVAAAVAFAIPVLVFYLGPDNWVVVALVGVLAEFGITFAAPKNEPSP